jgi:hypothetical protein
MYSTVCTKTKIQVTCHWQHDDYLQSGWVLRRGNAAHHVCRERRVVHWYILQGAWPCMHACMQFTGNSAQLFKKFPVFYETWRSITVFTVSCHWILSWANLIQTTCFCKICFNIIHSCHGLASDPYATTVSSAAVLLLNLNDTPT